MAGGRSRLRAWVRRGQQVERFVTAIVGGGLCLVVGLWVLTLTVAWSLTWLGGLGLGLLGIAALAWGIRTPLTM